jgi:hypothetical protein
MSSHFWVQTKITDFGLVKLSWGVSITHSSMIIILCSRAYGTSPA